MQIIATPIEPHEICVLCHDIGRITLVSTTREVEEGMPEEIQICEPCLNEYQDSEPIWIELQRRGIQDFYTYRAALIRGDQDVMRSIAEPAPRSAAVDGIQWSVRRIEEAP